MEVSSIIILNILVLVLQFYISFTRFKNYGIILVLFSCIVFLLTKQDIYYDLALAQLLIFILLFAVDKLTKNLLNKKRNKEIDKMKIKDL